MNVGPWRKSVFVPSLVVMGIALAGGVCGGAEMHPAGKAAVGATDATQENARRMLAEGRHTFRFDTFGSEAFWGDALKLHQAIAGAIPAPRPPDGSYDRAAAARGGTFFTGKAKCATCHVPPLFTEPGNNLHAPSEIGVDSFQADRSPTHAYRTAPLKGLWSHQKGGFYHDGRFADLGEVVRHYDQHFGLQLSGEDVNDLIEYLKSL